MTTAGVAAGELQRPDRDRGPAQVAEGARVGREGQPHAELVDAGRRQLVVAQRRREHEVDVGLAGGHARATRRSARRPSSRLLGGHRDRVVELGPDQRPVLVAPAREGRRVRARPSRRRRPPTCRPRAPAARARATSAPSARSRSTWASARSSRCGRRARRRRRASGWAVSTPTRRPASARRRDLGGGEHGVGQRAVGHRARHRADGVEARRQREDALGRHRAERRS